MTTNKSKPIKAAALSLLARQPYTTRRITEKLLQKGYGQHETDDIIEWCTEEGYLNDTEWAVRAAELKARKGWDKYKISAYLRHYGIRREDVVNALDALEVTDEDDDV